MRIAVLMKEVPDLVEDLQLDGDQLAFDDQSYVPSEWDEQALEEALLLKEATGAGVTVVAVDTGEVDAMLYAALAKGADRAVKLTGDFARGAANRIRARALANFLRQDPHDLVLTGVQAIDDVDGQLAAMVAAELGWVHAASVRDVEWDASANEIRFIQEYAGGRMALMAASVPAVLGIQAARQAPRYVSIARIRQVTRTASLESVASSVDAATEPTVSVRLRRPVSAGRAEMWDDDAEAVADKLVRLLADRKLLGG